jgi:glycosyltransferase involved in cell wall biosynthesis
MGGGGGVVNALLAQELAKRHDVTVLTSQGLNLPPERVDGGVRVVRAPVFFRKQQAVANLFSMLAFLPMGVHTGKRLFKAGRYDIINTHFVLPTGPVGDALARFADVPNVLSLHGGDLYDPSKWLSPHQHVYLRSWVRRLLRRADVIVGQSRNTLENMRRFYSPELQGVQIPLGIRRPQAGAALRRHYGCQEADVLLVTVGRLVARKGLPQLITVMTALRNTKTRLLIVGTGPQEQLLKEEVRKQQLAQQILFLGYVKEAEKFCILQMCDLYVSTSQHEGFGLVFLEAMACGLPIVCYDHGGQTDFLRNRETGYLIPLNDTNLFKECCAALSSDPELRRAIGNHNKHLVEEYYIETCARKYEQLFYETVNLKISSTDILSS